MVGLNLHNIVGNALTPLNPWKKMEFIKTSTEWVQGQRQPVKTQKKVVLQGKLQPVSQQMLSELGYALNEYQYYRVYISADITQLDQLRQLGSDRFICEGCTYKIVAKDDWYDNCGWRELYCYLERATNENK